MLFAACISLSFLLPHFGHTNSLSFNVKLSFLFPQLEQNFEVGNHLSKTTTLSEETNLFLILPRIECCIFDPDNPSSFHSAICSS